MLNFPLLLQVAFACTPVCVAVGNAHSHETAHGRPSHEGDLWLGEGLSFFPEFPGEASGPEKSVTPLRTHSPVQITLLATGCLRQEDPLSREVTAARHSAGKAGSLPHTRPTLGRKGSQAV